MALPASGAISVGNIQAEFGIASPAAFSAFYRQGSHVGIVYDGVYQDWAPNVPTSGVISLSNFYSAKAFRALRSTTGVYGSRTGLGVVTTTSVTITVTSGIDGPMTYQWYYVSGDTFTVTSPTSNTTTFSKSGSPATSPKSGVYRCLCTDSAGRYVYSNTVTVDAEWF